MVVPRLFQFWYLLILYIHHVQPRNLNIALHAQVSPTNGPVVGSVMTTSGLKNAFLETSNMWGEHVEIGNVEIFYPFDYRSSFFSNNWDVIIIEGWFQSINSFIHEARRTAAESQEHSQSLSSHGPIILFWCLDPAFPGLEIISSLDIDGVMSNSYRAIAEINRLKPGIITSYVMLAAQLSPLSQPDLIESGGKRSLDEDKDTLLEEQVQLAVKKSKDRLVYVGSVGGLESKRLLRPLLIEAMKADLPICLIGREVDDEAECQPLVVFGAGWESTEFASVWAGLLPHTPSALSRVYECSFAVIGATMDDQREYGMVNNRVFEVLVTGALFITEHFTELEDLLGSWSPLIGGAACYVRDSSVTMLHQCVEQTINILMKQEDGKNEGEFNSSSSVEEVHSGQLVNYSDGIEVVADNANRHIWRYLLQRICKGVSSCARKKLILSAHTYKHRLHSIVEITHKIKSDRTELWNVWTMFKCLSFFCLKTFKL